MMKTELPIYSKSHAGIYLYGESLDPREVTKALGVQPTKSWINGEFNTTSSGHSIERKSGLWAIVRDCDYEALPETIHDLANTFRGWEGSLLLLPGVSSGKVSVFSVHEPPKSIDTSLDLEIGIETLFAICELGLELDVRMEVLGGS